MFSKVVTDSETHQKVKTLLAKMQPGELHAQICLGIVCSCGEKDRSVRGSNALAEVLEALNCIISIHIECGYCYRYRLYWALTVEQDKALCKIILNNYTAVKKIECSPCSLICIAKHPV